MTEKNAKLEKRAEAIVNMGLVTREGNGFVVATPFLRGHQMKYRVTREGGKTVCSCLYFEDKGMCEHVLATRIFAKAEIDAKNVDVLSRASVLDLREISPEQLLEGDRKLLKTDGVKIYEQGRFENEIRFFIIQSKSGFNQVRRFQNFCFCTCLDFHFRTGSACKHISATTTHYCQRCQKNESEAGKVCRSCEMDTAPLLRTHYFTPEFVGGKIKI
jgi:hypothetical protein